MAYMLSEYEVPKTRRAFLTSFCYKIVILEMINYYAPLIYLAFFKGFFVGGPVSSVNTPQ